MFKDFQLRLTGIVNYFELIMKADRKTGFNYFVSREQIIAILSYVEDCLIDIRNYLDGIHSTQLVFKNDLYGEIVEVSESR